MFKLKKRYVKMCIIIAIPLIVLVILSYASTQSFSKEKEVVATNSNGKEESIWDVIFNKEDEEGNDTVEELVENMEENPTNEVTLPPREVDSVPDSIYVLVNKELSLPKDYEPSDLVKPNVSFAPTAGEDNSYIRQIAATHLEQLFTYGKGQGIVLNAVSGYRSYERQYKIFTNNIKYKGLTHTIEFSAKPGYSEHQTGLAMDVSSASARNQLERSFGKTIEGQWLAKHAHEFGFIIRYPEDKTEITGYAYEPWHVRYVGKELATYLYENNLTLEEYYEFEPTIDFDNELTLDTLWKYGIDIKDVVKPTKAPTNVPTPTVVTEELEDGEDGEVSKDEEVGLDENDGKVDTDHTGKDGTDADDTKKGNDGKDKGKNEETGKDKTPVTTNTPTKPVTPTPTTKPSIKPTNKPTKAPTEVPTEPENPVTPTVTPTDAPAITPTVAPEEDSTGDDIVTP